MKCKKCGQRASVNMPHHHMGLCKAHFLEWVPEQAERSIEKYDMFSKEEKILVAVSGGKDFSHYGISYPGWGIKLMVFISASESMKSIIQ